MKKVLTVLIILAVLAAVVLPVEHYYGDNIYAHFAFSDSPVVKVKDDTYRCAKDSIEDFVEYMKNDGWDFVDQLGSGYIFEKGDERVLAIVSIKEFYAEWKVSDEPKPQTDPVPEDEHTTVPAAEPATKLPDEPIAAVDNLEAPLGTAPTFGEDSEYAAHVVFHADKDIKNFSFFKVNMTYDEENNTLTGTPEKEYGSLNYVKAGEEVILMGDTGETLPFLAVSFESLSGKTYYYAIQISGEDGHSFLTPFEIAE